MIPRFFGFWVLLASSCAWAFRGDGTEAAIFLVGAVLFDAVKELNKSIQTGKNGQICRNENLKNE